MGFEPAKNVDYWVKRWQHVTLPVLPQTRLALDALREHIDSVRPTQIAEQALRDPVFSLQVLRAINGMPRGRYAAPVVEMNNAVLLLGGRRFVEQFSRFPDLDGFFPAGSPQRPRLLALLRQSRLAAALAWEWGKLRLDVRAEELHLAALLHAVQSCLALCDAELQRELAHGNAAAQEAAIWLDGPDACAVLARLLTLWRFPEHVVDLAVESRQQSPRAQCVRLAVRLAKALGREDYRDEAGRVLADTEQALKVEPDRLWALLRQAVLKEARRDPLQGIDPVARHWFYLPEPARPAAPAPEAPPQPARPRAAEALAVFAALPPEAPINAVFKSLFQVLQQHLALTRIVLLVPSSDRARLLARHCIGDGRFGTLAVPLQGEHLLARLMGRTQTLWLHANNAPRLRPLLRAEERELLGDNTFFAASLCAQEKPVALLLADRPDSADELDGSLYQVFQQLSADVARRLQALTAPAAAGA